MPILRDSGDLTVVQQVEYVCCTYKNTTEAGWVVQVGRYRYREVDDENTVDSSSQ